MVELTEAVWKKSEHAGDRLLVLLYLAYMARSGGYAWPSQEEIAARTKVEKRRLKRVLKALTRSGELALIARGTHHEPNIYRILLRLDARRSSGTSSSETRALRAAQSAPDADAQTARDAVRRVAKGGEWTLASSTPPEVVPVAGGVQSEGWSSFRPPCPRGGPHCTHEVVVVAPPEVVLIAPDPLDRSVIEPLQDLPACGGGSARMEAVDVL